MRAAKIGAICMCFILLISMSNVFGASASDMGANIELRRFVQLMLKMTKKL